MEPARLADRTTKGGLKIVALIGRAVSRNEERLAQGVHRPTSLGASTTEEVLEMRPRSGPRRRGRRPHTGCWQVRGLPRRPVSPTQAPRPAGSRSTDATSVWPKPRGRTPGFKGPRGGRPPGLLAGRAGPPVGPDQLHSAAPFSPSVNNLDTPPSS